MHSYAPYDSTAEGCVAVHPYDSTADGCVAVHPYDSTADGCIAVHPYDSTADGCIAVHLYDSTAVGGLAVHPACQSAAAWHTSGRGGGHGISIAGGGRDGLPADDTSCWPW